MTKVTESEASLLEERILFTWRSKLIDARSFWKFSLKTVTVLASQSRVKIAVSYDPLER